MKQHKITWVNIPGYTPETLNPFIGCSKISAGCENCYAETQAHIRSFNSKTPQYQHVIDKGRWNGKVHMVESQLYKPYHWKKPRAIFVGSMGDIFHESISFERINQLFSIMSDSDQHVYILLTKRPNHLLNFINWKSNQLGVPWQPKNNVWIGVSAENQKEADWRIPILQQMPIAVKFVSIEPMLGPINLTKWMQPFTNCTYYDGGCTRPENVFADTHNPNSRPGISSCRSEYCPFGSQGLNWVIVGGETGPKARPMHPDWVRSVRDQCQKAGTPFFFKQWGRWSPYVDSWSVSDIIKSKTETKVVDKSGAVYNAYEGGFLSWVDKGCKTVYRVGRKPAPNLLDGKQYHNWPI